VRLFLYKLAIYAKCYKNISKYAKTCTAYAFIAKCCDIVEPYAI